jgi:hypothetical protein
VVKVVAFKWQRPGYRSTFDAAKVNTHFRTWWRHSTVPFEAVCITDDPAGLDSAITAVPIWDCPVPNYGGGNEPNCFRRLKLFDADFPWIWTDLDGFVCGNVDHILSDPAEFRIWRPDGGRSKCNGSLVSHKPGARRHFWTSFDPSQIGSVAEFREKTQHLGSDQAWIASHLTENDQFFGQSDGVYAFRSLRNQRRERELAKSRRVPLRPTLPSRVITRDSARRSRISARMLERRDERIQTALPANAALVYFPGQFHPWDREIQKVYPWIEEHYR